MGEAERKRLDHVVLPRRLPGLALLERYFPSPADNQLDAELAAFARRRRHRPRSVGRHRLDRAPRGRGHGMRAVAADPSPSRQLAGQAFLLAPEPRRSTPPSPSSPPRAASDVPLRQHLEELYATRCADLPSAGRRGAVHLAPRR